MIFPQMYADDLAATPMHGLPHGSSFLITGATGSIGQVMVDTLAIHNQRHAAGFRIYAAGRDLNRLQARFGHLPGVICIQYDAEQPFAPQIEANYIVHAACSAHPMAYSTNPVGTMRANITGTMELLECARRWNASFLLLSSGEVYGEFPTEEAGFSETDICRADPMDARACYPESKRAAETLCAAYCRQYGIRAMSARLSHTYGPMVAGSNSRADAQFLYRALAGEDIILRSSGSQVRSFIYAVDCAGALIAILARGESGQAYNVSAPGCIASIREYAQLLVNIAGVGLSYQEPSLAEKAGYSKIPRAVLNPAKLMALGWEPRFSLEEGLEHTFAIAREINNER